MQTNKWNGVNPYQNETPDEKAARHKAKRAAARALGIKKNGRTKRKTRAARNVNDRIRRDQAEAEVQKLTGGAKASEEENSALNRASSDRPPLAAAPKRLVWPAAAASEPDPPPAPVAAPRVPSPRDDFEEKERAATASPEPEEHGSDKDSFSPSSNYSAGASPVGSPSP
jgi:hypothetical protein